MRIAFVSANREQLPDPVVPLGLLSVMANTPAVHDTVLWDLCFERDPVGSLAAHIASWRPDLLAVGLRNVQNSDYTNIEDNLRYYAQLVAVARQAGVPVVLGGAGFSVMPAEILGRLGAEYGISGEGEAAFPALLACLGRAGEGLEAVPNLHRWVEGAVQSNPGPARLLDLDTLTMARRDAVDPRYYERVGIESLQTKRGCPLGCEYCTYPLIEGRRHRLRDPVRVVDELEAALAVQPGMNHFFFVDSVFTLPPRHAAAVCRELIDRRLDLSWTCYANPIGFDRELAGLMRAAGCVGMEIGTDSGSDAILERQRKGFTAADVHRMHDICVEAGLLDCHTFVLGTTGETLAHVVETLDFLDELQPFAAILMMWMEDLEALDPTLSLQRRAFRDAVRDMLVERCASRPRWIAPQLRIAYDPRIFRILRKKGFTGPLWQYIHLNG
jgi:radical SAM superfamily enzyme YgiQ (UPF0313 family)